MKLLRPLAGYTLYDHKTNNSIPKELRITSTLDKIDEYRKKWLLHIQRMSQNRIPLKSYNYRPQGRRSIGRPKKRWREQLQPWRRNGSKGPILDVYDDDDDDDDSVYLLAVLKNTNSQSTLSAVLRENQILLQSRNSLRSFAAKRRLYEGASKLWLSQKKFPILLGKTIPVQAWRVPQGSRRLRLQQFLYNRHMKLAKLSALRTGRLYSPEHNPSKLHGYTVHQQY